MRSIGNRADYRRSLLLESSRAGILHGRSCGRHPNTSSENSEKSTSYSVRMPSVSGSISPACPNDFMSRLKPDRSNNTVRREAKASFKHIYVSSIIDLIPQLIRFIQKLTLQRSCCLLASV